MSLWNETSFVSGSEAGIELEWFAIQVKLRYEERVASTLLDKGFESLSATVRPSAQNRIPGLAQSRALFPGYIFSRFNVLERMPILVTPGVQGIVGYGKRPTAVDEREIAAIRQALQSGQVVEPCPYVGVGDVVEVTDGPLRGMQGILVQMRSCSRVVVSVSLIQRSIRVEVDQNALRPLRKSPGLSSPQPSCTASLHAAATKF